MGAWTRWGRGAAICAGLGGALGGLAGCDDGAPAALSDAEAIAADAGGSDAAVAAPVCDPSEILSERCEAEWQPAPLWVVAELAFAVEDADGFTPGFNLDDDAAGRGGAAGCGRADFVSPEGVEGIDNQLATLWPLLAQTTGAAVDGLIQGAINEGKLLITMAVGDEADGPTTFAVGTLAGVPLLGTDGLILPDQTFGPDPLSTPVWSEGRWQAGRFEGGGLDVVLPIDILDFQLAMRVSDARFAFRRLPDGSLEGLFGGGVQVAEFMAALDDAAVPLNLRDLLRTLMTQRADLSPDADGTCRALSTALVFRAVPAYLADWDVTVRPTPP